MATAPQVLKLREFADYLRVHSMTIYRLVKKGSTAGWFQARQRLAVQHRDDRPVGDGAQRGSAKRLGMKIRLNMPSVSRLELVQMWITSQNGNSDYNPSTGTLSPATAMTSARIDHVAVLLNNGNVLIADGVDSAEDSLATAEIFNGTSFAVTGSISDSRRGATATVLPNGQVLICGGTKLNRCWPAPNFTILRAGSFP